MRRITKNEFDAMYLIYKELASDKQYQTYLAMKEDSSGNLYPVVLKEMDEKRAAIYAELSCMWNPYLADTYDIFLLSEPEHSMADRYIAVTEYVCADGSPDQEALSLTQFVKRNGPMPETAALSVCVQLCEGLKDFHQKGFVHRDLKPDNIMIASYDTEHPKIKIIDFGGAKQTDRDQKADSTVIGTIGYQAPESISSLTTNQADIYSIGCILNFMLTGQEPGILEYSNKHYIASIIEKATYESPYHRYYDVTALQKEAEHELRTRPLDKIPILRSVPGFRTHTLWKEVIALLFYIAFGYLSFIYPIQFGISGFMIVAVFYVILPLIFLLNMGNLHRFFPGSLRHNAYLFFMTRLALTLASFFVPLSIEFIMMGG